MRKGKLIGKIFGIALVFAMIGAMLGGLVDTASAQDTAGSFQYPLSGTWSVSRNFSVWVDNWNGEGASGYHLGEDVPASPYIEVYASANGKVRYTSTNISGYGSIIIIEHRLPNGSYVCTLYGHLSKSKGLKVNVGDDVQKGQLIAYIGDTNENGGWSPHIHFGIRKGAYSTATYCGHWPYVGYSLSCVGITHEQYRDMWYDPSDFLNTHQGITKWGKSHNVAVIDDYYGSAVGYLYPSDYPNQTFSALSASQVSAETLASYDTVILFMFNPSGLTTDQKAAIDRWVSNGGKLIIWDSDQVTPGAPWDYSWLPYLFTTSVPGEQGAYGKGLNILEENQLSSSDASSPYYIDTAILNSQTDAVGDANVLTSYSSGWQIDMMATNILGETGPAHVYASWGSGLIIYSALDWDYAGSTTGVGLKKMLRQELDCSELPFAAPPVPGEVGLTVEVTSEAPEGYYKDKPIGFKVTITNPTDHTGINLEAHNVRLTVIAPEEIEVELPPGGLPVVNIAPGDSNIVTFNGTMKQIGNNFVVKVNAIGYTDLGPIGGSGICYVNVHESVIPDYWSFAIITDLHIGFDHRVADRDGDGKPEIDYEGIGWNDSEPGGADEYWMTEALEAAVDTIIAEAATQNIKFVVVLGDLADTAERSEFLKAREILNRLNDRGIPYIPVIGNHDVWPYTQEGSYPHNRDWPNDTNASWSIGDELFEEVFWDQNPANLQLAMETLKDWHIDAASEIHFQNYAFSYWEEEDQTDRVDFVCLDLVSRNDPPDSRWNGYAVNHWRTMSFLRNYLEDHGGKRLVIFSHNPLCWGGEEFHADAIFEPALDKYEKVYSFGGHIHLNFWVTADEGRKHVVCTEALEAAQVNQYGGEWGLHKLASGLDLLYQVDEDFGKCIRVVTVSDDDINYLTTLRPSRDVDILWPSPFFTHTYASYPEPNKEITFTAYYTTYHGFEASFDWDFADGSYGSGSSVTHAYSQEGDYEVTLTVTTRNLITGEETVQTVTEIVYVRTKHVISPLPPDLYATALLTEEDLTQVPKNTYQPALITKIASEETPIAELGVHFEEANGDIDLSSMVADVDLVEAKSVLYMPSWPEEIEEYKLLYIPSTGTGAVYVCKNATSLGEVSLENADVIINVGETKDNMTVATTFYNGREYYLVSGVTGTGGGEIQQAANEPPVGGKAYPINKVGVAAPWVALFAAIVAGAAMVTRRRRAQS